MEIELCQKSLSKSSNVDSSSSRPHLDSDDSILVLDSATHNNNNNENNDEVDINEDSKSHNQKFHK